MQTSKLSAASKPGCCAMGLISKQKSKGQSWVVAALAAQLMSDDRHYNSWKQKHSETRTHTLLGPEEVSRNPPLYQALHCADLLAKDKVFDVCMLVPGGQAVQRAQIKSTAQTSIPETDFIFIYWFIYLFIYNRNWLSNMPRLKWRPCSLRSHLGDSKCWLANSVLAGAFPRTMTPWKPSSGGGAVSALWVVPCWENTCQFCCLVWSLLMRLKVCSMTSVSA